MKSQAALIDVIGTFTPKIVKMAGPETNPFRKKKKDEIMGE
ncbi:hypothetical protein [Parafilimonas sp.]